MVSIFATTGCESMIAGVQQLTHLSKIGLGIYTKKRAFCGPLWVQIGVSNRCNYRCVMCWDHPTFVPKDDPYPDSITSKYYRNNPGIDRSSKVMDFALFTKTIEDLHAVGTRRVDLVGRGEPFLNEDLMQMVAFVKGKGMYCSISTNGSLLTEQALSRLVGEGLDQLIVSLNTGRPETYGKIHTSEDATTFFRIKEALVGLNQLKVGKESAGPIVTLSFVLCKSNFREVGEMVGLAQEVGAKQAIFKHAVLYDGISFLGLTEEEKGELDRALIEAEQAAARSGLEMKLDPPIGSFLPGSVGPPSPMEVYGKIPCTIGWLFALITADGTVLPCCHCFSAMGNVEEESFARIWRSEPYERFRDNAILLPNSGKPVPTCRCDVCTFTKFNLSVHNHLHPFRRKVFYPGQREYNPAQLLSSLVLKRTARGPKRGRPR